MIGRIRHRRRVLAWHVAELAGGLVAFLAAHVARASLADHFKEALPPLREILWLAPLYLASWSAFAWGSNAYRAFRIRGPLSHAFNLGVSVALAAFSLFGLLMVLHQTDVNRSLVLFTAVAHFVIVFPMRIAARTLLGYYTTRGYDRHFVLVVGTRPEAV